MSAYEELVERVARAGRPKAILDVGDHCRDLARAQIAEVFRTLETVTPEMAFEGLGETSCNHMFRAMLRASPLAPPQPDGGGR